MSLPSGYKQLEYIQSSGTQYIDTGFKPNQSTRVVAVVGADDSDCIFGTADGYGSKMYSFIGTGSNSFRSDYGNTLDSVNLSDSVLASPFKIDKNENITSVNGTVLLNSTSNTFQCSYPLLLFAFNNVGSVLAYASFELYSLKIYDSGTLIRDFIPFKDESGNIGLWDDVNGVFYGNAGTGTFMAGPVLKPDTPSDLTSSVDDGTVTLSWSAVSGATGYKISRDGVLISAQTGLTYTETVTKGQTYTYSVVAYNDYGDSDPATLSVNVPLIQPSTPSNFAASVSGLSATLSWDAPAKATGYRLYRDGVLLSDQTDTGYTDAVEPFVSYVYTLIAYNDDGESDPATISVQVIIPPEAPSNFRASSASMTAISLAWDAVTGADGYQLKRNGSVIYSGDGTSYTDSGLTAGTAYTYTLAAVNTAGSSAETTLEATTTKFVLVTDRTQADVTAGNAKGTYKASDLNRVGVAMNYVADRLKAAGYDPHISPKADWKDDDWVDPEAQAVYLGDLAELRKQFAMMKSTPEVPPRILATAINSNDGLTYTWANDIEQILMDIDALLTNIAAGWLYSGEIYSGEV